MTLPTRYIVLIAIVLTPLTLHAAEIPDAISDVVRARVDSGKTASMVIGIVDADGVSYFSYGSMSTSDDRTPDENSVYEIGSITKVFTGILLADAVSRNEVHYDDSIEMHLPEDLDVPTKNDKTITLEMLSVQNSGISRLPSNLRIKNPGNPYADYTNEEMYKALSRLRMRREAGESYEYSNFGVGLLGHLLERASGKSYEELLINRIATPLDMPDTRITFSPAMLERLAKGHVGEKEVPNWDIPTLAGAGAIRSTAHDMIRFLQANLGLIDSPLLESMKETHVPRTEAGSKQMHIGLGWHILTPPKGPDIVWHNGGTGGYRSFAGFTQDPPRAVVVLTNSGGPGDDDIGFHILNDSLPLSPKR